jgi:hypothetical protein
MAEGQGFEPWVGYKPTPVFKTGALNHSATLPLRRELYMGFLVEQPAGVYLFAILRKKNPRKILGFFVGNKN